MFSILSNQCNSSYFLHVSCFIYFLIFQSRCLNTAELADPKMSVEIAEKLARFHLLDLPLCKVPKWLNDVLDKWSSMTLTLDLDNPKDQAILDEIRSFDLQAEIKFVKTLISNSKSRIVFCHNDCQEGMRSLPSGPISNQDLGCVLSHQSLVIQTQEHPSFHVKP
jgi:hypothetical protein